MQKKSKLVSSLIFAASLLCFFFPFVTISCGGQKLMTLTGTQLATGTSLNQPQSLGKDRTDKIDPNPFAMLAVVCAIAGIAFSLAQPKIAIASAISGAAGAVSLLIMKSGMDNEVTQKGGGVIELNYEMGFVLSLLLFVAAAAWNGYVYAQARKRTSVPLPSPGAPPAPSDSNRFG